MKSNQSFTRVLKAAFVGSSMLATCTMLAPNSASAAVFGCAPSIADNVTNTTGCQVSNTANQDSVAPNKPLTVNQEGFFGKTDWSFGGKIGTDAGFTGKGSGQSGTWNISSVFKSSWSDVMLVFKSGNGTFLTGYEVKDGATSGQWTSPFEILGKDPKDVSHISVYFREGSNPSAGVPEPTTMAGLALAGAGMAAYRRRMKVKSAE